MEYVLPATSLSDEDCDKIDTMIHKTLLPKLGVVRSLSIAYRSAPSKYQGLGSLHTSSKQFLLKIKLFLQHANTNSQLGLNITNGLESLHLLMGVNTPLFQLSYEDYGFLSEETWITHIWMKASQYGFVLQGSYTKPNIIRKGDFPLMEALVQSNRMSQADMLSVNRCRVYLHAQNVSDIATGDGLYINQRFLQSNIQPIQSKYVWPHQVKPPSSDWKHWRKAILEIWNHNEQGILTNPMGPILVQSHLEHEWFYSPATKSLYHQLQVNKYLSYDRLNLRTRNNSVFHDPSVVDTLPPDTLTAIVNSTNRLRPILESSFSQNKTIDHNSPLFERDIFYKDVNLPRGGILMANVIRNRNAIAVCDASAKNAIGAASWIMTNSDDSVTINGDHGVPPSHSKMDSYRAELYGIYAILETLHILEEKFQIRKGAIHIACDNLMALNNSFVYGQRAPVTASDFDILWAIYDLRSQITTEITFEHVYGHRDKDTKDLTHLEQLNVQMNKRAGEYRIKLQETQSPQYSNLHSIHRWNIYIDDKPVTRYLEKNLQNEIFKKKMFTHLVEKKKYHAAAPRSINWDAIEIASNQLTLSRKLWLTKFVSGFLPTAKAMKDRGNWETSMCPVCQKCVETSQHLIECEDEAAVILYNKEIQKLDDWMQTANTDPIIRLVIISSLQDKKGKTPFYDESFLYQSKHVANAAQNQDLIGWFPFFKGHLSKLWVDAQCNYLQSENEPHANEMAKKWAHQLVTQMYSLSYALWEYRNSILHAKTDESLNEKESARLNKSIEKEYARGSMNLNSVDKKLIEIDFHELMEKSVAERKSWLVSVQAARICFKKNKDNTNMRMRRGLLNWMRTGSLRCSSLPDG